MICRKTMEECKTPSMCAPFQGCTSAGQLDDTSKLHQRIRNLEAQLNAAIVARRDAQLEAQHAREARNRAGVEVRKDMARQLDTARLDGWQAAREQAAKVCDVDKELSRNSLVRSGIAISAARIRAMHPPAEWQCAEVPPVCGAAKNAEIGALANEGTKPESLCKSCVQADVSCPVYPQDAQHCVEYAPKWPHPDGFAGGLTEHHTTDAGH